MSLDSSPHPLSLGKCGNWPKFCQKLDGALIWRAVITKRLNIWKTGKFLLKEWDNRATFWWKIRKSPTDSLGVTFTNQWHKEYLFVCYYRQGVITGLNPVLPTDNASTECTTACYGVSWNCSPRVSVLWFASVLWHCWLGDRKGIRPVKNWVVGYWRGYLSGARCRLAYGPADATATHCLLLQ